MPISTYSLPEALGSERPETINDVQVFLKIRDREAFLGFRWLKRPEKPFHKSEEVQEVGLCVNTRFVSSLPSDLRKLADEIDKQIEELSNGN